MSDQIISRIDDMGSRIDDLEHNINDLMAQVLYFPDLKFGNDVDLRLDRAEGHQRWKTRIKETQSDPG